MTIGKCEQISHPTNRADSLVSVVVRLVGSGYGHSEVLRLILGQGGELDSEVVEVEAGHLLVQGLGQDEESDGVLGGSAELGPQLDLSEHLQGDDERMIKERMMANESETLNSRNIK